MYAFTTSVAVLAAMLGTIKSVAPTVPLLRTPTIDSKCCLIVFQTKTTCSKSSLSICTTVYLQAIIIFCTV